MFFMYTFRNMLISSQDTTDLIWFQLGKIIYVEKDTTAVNKRDKYTKLEQTCDNEDDSTNLDGNTTCDTTLGSKEDSEPTDKEVNDESALVDDNEESRQREKASKTQNSETKSRETQNLEVMSSILATMWIGDDAGNLYVHSSVANWAQCLHTVKLKEPAIAIV